MDVFLSYVFRIILYIGFGLVMEVFVTGLSRIETIVKNKIPLFDGKLESNEEKLYGQISLWMVPVYGLLLPFVFEPVYNLVGSLHIVFRYLIWCVCFTFFEALAGFMYYKWLGFVPWDYTQCKYKVGKQGFTRLDYLPLWGIAGMLIEFYSKMLVFLSPYFNEFIKGL